MATEKEVRGANEGHVRVSVQVLARLFGSVVAPGAWGKGVKWKDERITAIGENLEGSFGELGIRVAGIRNGDQRDFRWWAGFGGGTESRGRFLGKRKPTRQGTGEKGGCLAYLTCELHEERQKGDGGGGRETQRRKENRKRSRCLHRITNRLGMGRQVESSHASVVFRGRGAFAEEENESTRRKSRLKGANKAVLQDQIGH